LIGRVELGEFLDRREEDLQVADEGDYRADLDRAVDRLGAAVEDNRRGAGGGEQFDRREGGGVEEDSPHVRLAVCLVEIGHRRGMAWLLAEAAHHAYPAQRLLQVC